MHLLPFLVDPTRDAVDGGANRGSYCFFLSRLCRHVHAFEPNPAMRAYLRGAVGSNVTIYADALSDGAGEAVFAVPRKGKVFRNTSGTLEAGVYGADAARFSVRRTPLDALGLPPVGFIKLDVEGHELPALRGGAGLIARDRPVILMEVMTELTGRPVMESVREVEGMGYVGFAVVERRLELARRVPVERYAAERPSYPGSRRVNNFIFFPA
jgi:FkbM family methyltransferase